MSLESRKRREHLSEEDLQVEKIALVSKFQMVCKQSWTVQKNRAIIESFNKGGAAVVGMTPPEEGEEVSDAPLSDQPICVPSWTNSETKWNTILLNLLNVDAVV